MRKLKLALFAFLALGIVSFAFVPSANYSPVFAEEEPTSSQPVETSSEQPQESEEEAAKWKELYEKAEAKVNEMANYQVLGITIGSIASVLVSLGLSYLMGKINRDNIRKQGEQLVLSEDNITRVGKIANQVNDNALDFKTNAAIYIQKADEQVKIAEETKDAIKEENETLKAQMKSEREMFLSIISNDKDLVANGTAEKLNKLFGNHD